MITVAGLTFSMTMLTLQLASSQFGPRLLRSFLRDRGNQVVLGTFISTFVYCLLVLRTVRGTEDASFVPHLSVAIGFGLAIASLAVLIFFIHHTATAIRVESVLSGLAAETREAIDRLYPATIGDGARRGAGGPPRRPCPTSTPTGARYRRPGRLRAGRGRRGPPRPRGRHDVVLRVEARPGRFVIEGDALLTAAPRGPPATRSRRPAGRRRAGRRAHALAGPRFSLRRIVEIAQRALSPGINDPTTASYCIDRLEEALCHLAGREMPSGVRLDEARRFGSSRRGPAWVSSPCQRSGRWRAMA